MQNPITKKSQQGFTLIELLIVVAIIGILAAIAIPQYAQYRTSAMNSAAESELKNIQTSLEGYYSTNNYSYPNNTSSVDVNTLSALDFETSNKVTAQYIGTSDGQDYAACAYHTGGDTKYFVNSTMSSMNSTDCGSAGGCTISLTDLTGC
jgi:prepilin-type N-terminal cleavage/methylation domain-containing protein